MTQRDNGELHLIVGPMFSGKSTELLRRLAIESSIGFKVLYINSKKDDRSAGPFSTHNPLYMNSLLQCNIDSYYTDVIDESVDVSQYDVIGIDEGQFFPDLKTVVRWVDKLNKHIIIAGLTTDYKREKFGKILELECHCDTITKLSAWCGICSKSRIHSPALFTHKFTKNELVEETGGKDKYIALCRKCYLKSGAVGL